MPTVLRIGSDRFFFCANEQGEPHHIRVQHAVMLTKFWLNPVALARSTGFSAQDLSLAAELGRSQSITFRGAME